MESSQIGSIVKAHRIKKGFSQDALASASGINQRTVQRIEKGESRPTGDTLNRLAKALELELSELLDQRTEKHNSSVIKFHLSALWFLLFPVLGFIIPMILRSTKKSISEYNKDRQSDLINFEINWVMLLIFIPGIFWIGGHLELLDPLSFRFLFYFLLVMYSLNTVIILFNVLRAANGKEVRYFSVIKFLV